MSNNPATLDSQEEYDVVSMAENEWEDPIEPPPPPLPNTPPDTPGVPDPGVEMKDASIPNPPLYKYPNIMKRNVRYRGHRESEKYLHDHQEQIYDIRQLYKEIRSTDIQKDTAIDSWFHGEQSFRISMIDKENERISREIPFEQEDIDVDRARAFKSDVIQLGRNNFEERIVGVYGIKQRMQELDERIAEAERRYRIYENAYE